MDGGRPVELARLDAFRLGTLRVDPPLRQAVADDGRAETIEPRILQVLVVLARARGSVVTRDDLILSCWDGRIVGDDAINRVIARLRRLAGDLAGGSFRIETIAKVGYRLVETAPAPRETATLSGPQPAPDRRRRALIALATGTAVLTGVSALLWRRFGIDDVPAEIAPLLDQAAIAVQQGTAEGADQAIGLLRRAVALRPDNADAWGMLATTYAVVAQSRTEPVRGELRSRSGQAIERARTLDRDNGHAALATALLLPQIGHWGEVERILATAERRDPESFPLRFARASLLASVGRCRDAADVIDRAAAGYPPTPALVHLHAQLLWAAGRSEDADRALAEAFALYPTHFAVWFGRYHLLLFTGRAGEALAQVRQVEGRPIGVSERDFEMLATIAETMTSPATAATAGLVEVLLTQARRGAGYAENAMQYAAALSDVDAAFDIADAYFFGRGFTVDPRRFAPQQRTYTVSDDRRTRFLFLPSTAAMRRNARFARLVAELGLDTYWRESGTIPDYRRWQSAPAKLSVARSSPARITSSA